MNVSSTALGERGEGPDHVINDPNPSRRRILNWFLGTSAGALLISILYPVTRYIIPPKVEESTARTVILAIKPEEVKPNSGQIVRFAMVEMLVGYSLVFAGISILAEGWREVYLATKEGRLATDRLYGVVRHPQYTGIFLAIFGQLIHWPTIPTLVLFPVIVWAYYRLAKKEERDMLRKFGMAYETYRQSVPMFFARQGKWKKLMSAGEFRESED